MPTLPWRSFKLADPENQYLVLLSYLPLKHSWRIPQFVLHTACIMDQLRKSSALLGYSLRAELRAKRFWTLSAWQDEAALQMFVRTQPHSHTMNAMVPRMGKTGITSLDGQRLRIADELGGGTNALAERLRRF